jgi:hypothetical protein
MKKSLLFILLTLFLSFSFSTGVQAQNVRQDNYCDAFGGVCGCDETTGKQVCCEGILNDTYSCQEPTRLNYPSFAQAFPATSVYATAVPNDRGTFSVYVNWADEVPTEYSITLTQFPGQDPGPFADTSSPEFAFFDIPTGIWYANIKKNINGQWSQVTSWKVTVPEWSTAIERQSEQAVIVDPETSGNQPGRLVGPAAQTERSDNFIANVPDTLFYVVVFVVVLFIIVIVALLSGRNRLKKLEELVHKMRLDISTIMGFLKKKYPDEKMLVSHSQIKLNGVLSAEEKRIVQDVGFEGLYTKHHTYFIDKIKSYSPKNAHDVAYASYQIMERLDNKEVKNHLKERAEKYQWTMHEVNIACADYLAIKASDEVLK